MFLSHHFHDFLNLTQEQETTTETVILLI